jgi:predicted Fe-S protein YdhL (DUF1289 family)
VKPTPGNLRSPCVSVCRIDVATGYCAGCYRTIEEISDWGMMTDDRKRDVWRQLKLRRTALSPATPTDSPAPPDSPDSPVPDSPPPPP